MARWGIRGMDSNSFFKEMREEMEKRRKRDKSWEYLLKKVMGATCDLI